MVLIFEVCDIFFNVVDMVVETVNIVFFSSNLCSKTSFFNRADGYKFNSGVVIFR